MGLPYFLKNTFKIGTSHFLIEEREKDTVDYDWVFTRNKKNAQEAHFLKQIRGTL